MKHPSFLPPPPQQQQDAAGPARVPHPYRRPPPGDPQVYHTYFPVTRDAAANPRGPGAPGQPPAAQALPPGVVQHGKVSRPGSRLPGIQAAKPRHQLLGDCTHLPIHPLPRHSTLQGLLSAFPLWRCTHWLV
jgi:hypothetical protein